MKLSFTTLACPDWTLAEIPARAAGYGYDGVEVRVHEDGRHLRPDVTVAEARRAAAAFRDAGVPVMALMGYTRFAAAEAAERGRQADALRRLVGIAAAMGAGYVRTFAGRVEGGAGAESAAGAVADALAPVTREAAAAGVTVALETHDDWCAGRLVRAVADRVGPAGFGIVYDVFNALHAGFEPWEETYGLVRPRLAYLHLKDGVREGGRVRYVPLGEGELPLRPLLSRLRADGYGGWVSFEWEKAWHPELAPPEDALPRFIRTMRAALAERAS